MAEALGIAASILQIADGALKFKKLCSEIKHASDDVQHLIDEVTILASVLGDIETSSTCHLAVNSPTWQQCFRLFKSSAEGMSQITIELEEILRAHRVTGKIRIHLKKDELERCKDRLERTKGIMTLAQQTYSFALLTQQNEKILDEVRMVAMCQQSQTVAIENASKSVVRTELAGDDVAKNTDQRVTRRSRRLAPKEASSLYNIRLPTWILRTGLQILVDRSNRSWSLNIRTYNQVPNNAEVFCLAHNGRWDDVRRLMDSGKASPWDVCSSGKTLLWVAADQFDISACTFLLNLGMDPLLELGWSEHALGRFSSRVSHRRCHHTKEDPVVYEMISLLSSHSDLVIELDDLCTEQGNTLSDRHLRYLNGLARDSLLVLLDTVAPGYTNLNKFSRARLACQLDTSDPDAIELVLGPGLTLRQAFDELRTGLSSIDHHTMLIGASEALARQSALLDPDQSVIHKWETVIRSIVEYESRCTGSFNWESSLFHFLNEYCRTVDISLQPGGSRALNWNNFFTQTGRIWIGILQRVGADLLRYGAAEEAYFSNTGPVVVDVNDWYLQRHSREATHFDLRYLIHGPKECDWFIYVVPIPNYVFVPHCTVEYEMAGRFWDWIENPEFYEVPGTFVEDDLDDVHDYEYTETTVQAPTL